MIFKTALTTKLKKGYYEYDSIWCKILQKELSPQAFTVS